MTTPLRPAVVGAVTDVADSIRLLELVPADGVTGYAAGAHLDLAVVAGGLPDVRSYSLVDAAPVGGAYRIAVKLLPDTRGGSAFVHGLTPGGAVEIAGPRSDVDLHAGRPAYLVIAGGIGITAARSVTQWLVGHGREVALHYAGTARSAMAFLPDLESLCGDRLQVAVDDEGSRLDVDTAVAALHPEGEAFVCGPLGLMEAVRAAWTAQGRPPTRLRMETFGASGRLPTSAFTVVLRDHGGREVEVPRSRTMLQALTAAGVPVMADCLRGECGLCAVTVFGHSAPLDHRDVFLSAAEQAAGGSMCACVSRCAGGRVEIDTGHR